MPTLSAASRKPIKGLVLADSGLGKTGMLWSLATAGFQLKLYDADANHGVLASALKDHPEAMANVQVNEFRDKLKLNDKGFADGVPKAWTGFLKALDKWPDGGGMNEWGPDVVAVFDTMTSLGKAALSQAQYIENKMGRLPEIQHYHTAMVQIEALLGNIISDHVKCHVLILTHINYTSNELGAMFGLPMAIGDKLSPKIPIYFNTMVALKRTGKKTILTTQPTAMVQTKVENFNQVQKEYELIADGVGKPGLAEFFADCGWPGTETPE